jgi:AraC-like DNA-binding protein/quercetin dioxygenase-like cupin family protein
MPPPRDLRLSASTLQHWSPSSPRPDTTAAPMISPQSVVGVWTLEHWLSVPWHDHDFYELAFIVEGTGFHFAGGEEVAIGPGTVIFIPPGTAHGYRANADVRVYNCFFRAELAEYELLWAARDSALGPLFGPPDPILRQPGAHAVVKLGESDFQTCIGELDMIRHADPRERSHAGEIGRLLIALDVIARRGHRATSSAPAADVQTSRVVSRAMELIERELGRPWTLADLANGASCSPYYLAHQFRRWINVSPMAYLARRRAQHAAFLLAGTDSSISSIGEAVGWPEPTSFSHQFRRISGESPRDYRNKMRESR